MVVYTEAGITYRVRWAYQPHVVPQGENLPPLKLLGVRLAGDALQVAVLTPPMGVVWVPADRHLGDSEAALWCKRGFDRRRL